MPGLMHAVEALQPPASLCTGHNSGISRIAQVLSCTLEWHAALCERFIRGPPGSLGNKPQGAPEVL